MAFVSQVGNHRLEYDRNPDVCPVCHHAIAPTVRGSSLSNEPNAVGAFMEIAFQCTYGPCRRLFIGRYMRPVTGGGKTAGGFSLQEVVPVTYRAPLLEEEILEISPSFKAIFEQANAAELYGLGEIAGVGYRKALEFLIKDYCIHKNPESEEAIKSAFLGTVIRDHVDDANVKRCAERATWLGNDETHYVRKWENKDINDLKVLIQLTCGWVRNNILTERYISDMGGDASK